MGCIQPPSPATYNQTCNLTGRTSKHLSACYAKTSASRYFSGAVIAMVRTHVLLVAYCASLAAAMWISTQRHNALAMMWTERRGRVTSCSLPFLDHPSLIFQISVLNVRTQYPRMIFADITNKLSAFDGSRSTHFPRQSDG